MLRTLTLGVMTAMLVTTSVASAETLRWARAGDSITLDPHAQNEGPTHTLAHQMYEPLLHRDMQGEIVPALSTEWSVTSNPNIWEFKLRQGVTFHGGESFDADDVVFSFSRAMSPTSAMKELLSSVSEVKKVDSHTVHFVTNGPNPLLPNNLTNLFIMDSGWAKAQKCDAPQDVANGGDNACVRSVNGTGAYQLISRAQDEKTVLKANSNYWGVGQFPLEVSEIIYTPIQEAATRVSALLSGEVDLIQDVPVQDLARVDNHSDLKLSTASQNRTIFFGMNMGDADLQNDNVEGKNPLADLRVRQAMNIAINRDAIKKVVMRDQSAPTGVIMPPFVHGWTKNLDAYPQFDLAKAQSLMADAGYSNGFGITLDCPNNRYINDEAICQAAVGMLGKIGIDVTLSAIPKAQHFPKIKNKTTDFYMLGWGVPTFDSAYIFNYLVHTTTDKLGSWNGTRYSNSEIDTKIQSLSAETDIAARNQTIADIWADVNGKVLYLPIHNQVLNWGMNAKIDFAVQPEDQPHIKYLSYSK